MFSFRITASQSLSISLLPLTCGLLLFAQVAGLSGAKMMPDDDHKSMSARGSVCEQIATNPFAPADRRENMILAAESRAARREIESMLPKSMRGPNEKKPGLGWSVSDQEYWRTIPAEAKRIPKNWMRLSALRFTNTELGGTRQLRYVAGEQYDYWLLNDPLHELRACMSIERNTRRIFFFEFTMDRDGKVVRKSTWDQCYTCHASGPRIIRPFDEPMVDRALLERFNRKLLSYGACDFGVSVDKAARGQRTMNPACDGCHDGKLRGMLFNVHRHLIDFKTRVDCTMPPRTVIGSG